GLDPEVPGPLAGFLHGGGASVRQCFASGDLGEYGFPKFAALVEYLQGYSGRERFHGVIFVRTKHAVFYLAGLMRRTQQLAGIEVTELVGQTGGPSAGDGGAGMTGAAQQQALRLFK
ncbi:hypothetical protein TSOC_006026, partial [Tetrabaena socialis]